MTKMYNMSPHVESQLYYIILIILYFYVFIILSQILEPHSIIELSPNYMIFITKIYKKQKWN